MDYYYFSKEDFFVIYNVTWLYIFVNNPCKIHFCGSASVGKRGVGCILRKVYKKREDCCSEYYTRSRIKRIHSHQLLHTPSSTQSSSKFKEN